MFCNVPVQTISLPFKFEELSRTWVCKNSTVSFLPFPSYIILRVLCPSKCDRLLVSEVILRYTGTIQVCSLLQLMCCTSSQMCMKYTGSSSSLTHFNFSCSFSLHPHPHTGFYISLNNCSIQLPLASQSDSFQTISSLQCLAPSRTLSLQLLSLFERWQAPHSFARTTSTSKHANSQLFLSTPRSQPAYRNCHARSSMQESWCRVQKLDITCSRIFCTNGKADEEPSDPPIMQHYACQWN